MKRILVILGVSVVLAMGLASCSGENDYNVPPDANEVTADDVVDAMPASTIVQFCDSWNEVIAYTGSDDAARDAFNDGYTADYVVPGDAVYDEFVSRCLRG